MAHNIPKRVDIVEYSAIDSVTTSSGREGIEDMTKTPQNLLRVKQAAERSNMSIQSIYKAIARGELRALRFGPRGLIRIPQDALAEWYAASIIPTPKYRRSA